MNPHRNIPPGQHRGQRFVDQFNIDEALRRRLEPCRRLRRAVRRWLTEAQHCELDLREFARAKPPVDCFGEPLSA